MTSSARPTWLPAVGGHSLRDTNNAPQYLYSSLDLPAHKKLKLRRDTASVPQIELRQKLIDAERAHHQKATGSIIPESERKRIANLRSNEDEDSEISDDDSDAELAERANGKRPATETNEEENSDDEDSDEDDTEELLRELEKIKQERAVEKERIEQERLRQERTINEEQAKSSNPLLNLTVSEFTVKKRWDDDVIFRNQARGTEKKQEKRFINDLLRSDFHRKFMQKYVR